MGLYKNKAVFIFPAMVLLEFRNAVRLFDFENTIEYKDFGAFLWIIIAQIISCVILSILHAVLFLNKKYVLIFNTVFIVFLSIAAIEAYNKL